MVRLLAAGVVISLVLAASALAAGTPKAGAYKATGHLSFHFRLTRGFCYLAPRNLQNPRAPRGRGGQGLCFSSVTTAPLHITCTGGGAIQGLAIDFSLFDRLRLTNERTLHVKAYTYESGPKPIGFFELNLGFSGSRATGFVRATDQIGGASGATSNCDTGKLAFTAR
jgi:hypothetical protein